MHVAVVVILGLLAVFNHGRPVFRASPGDGATAYCDAGACWWAAKVIDVDVRVHHNLLFLEEQQRCYVDAIKVYGEGNRETPPGARPQRFEVGCYDADRTQAGALVFIPVRRGGDVLFDAAPWG